MTDEPPVLQLHHPADNRFMFDSSVTTSRLGLRRHLNCRLEEGLDLDLLTLTRLPEDHGNAKRYELTQRGGKVKEQLESLDADRVYQTFIQMRQLLEDTRLGMKEWLTDSELTDLSWNAVEPRESHHDDCPYE